MKKDRRYSVTDCFETFPIPIYTVMLATTGETYFRHRKQVMLDRQEGLTKTYNRFHDPNDSIANIQKLLELHVEMDKAVAAAHGWTDLELGRDFHETKQGVRFTISESARLEVLQRLLKLNHERYAEEENKDSTVRREPPRKPPRRRKRRASPPNKKPAIFDGEDDE